MILREKKKDYRNGKKKKEMIRYSWQLMSWLLIVKLRNQLT